MAVTDFTRAAVEAEIAKAISRCHAEEQGVAPEWLCAHISGDMVIVRSSGVYSAQERELCQTGEGRKLVQSARREHRAAIRRAFESKITAIVGCPILRSFYDIDTRVGEQIEIYMLAQNLNASLTS